MLILHLIHAEGKQGFFLQQAYTVYWLCLALNKLLDWYLVKFVYFFFVSDESYPFKEFKMVTPMFHVKAGLVTSTRLLNALVNSNRVLLVFFI